MIELKKGDVFVVYGRSWISKLIRWSEKLWSQDNKAKASHSGIIIFEDGTTLEALYNGIRRYSIYDYKDKVAIYRHKDMDIERFWKGFDAVRKHEAQVYPYWRLLLHSIPILSKISLVGIPVCSELVAEFLYKAFVNDRKTDDLMMRYQNYYGWTPDELEDDWRIAKDFNLIYEGKIT